MLAVYQRVGGVLFTIAKVLLCKPFNVGDTDRKHVFTLLKFSEYDTVGENIDFE